MYPVFPLRGYGYNDFISFPLVSMFPNIPQEQIPHILSCIANDIVAKANSNPARMYIYNKLIQGGWQNQEFAGIACDIIAILSGKLTSSLPIDQVIADVTNKYLTCYTSVQVMLDTGLRSQLPQNIVVAAQDNSKLFQGYKDEAIRMMNQRQMQPGMMMQAQGQGYPMQQGMPMQGYPMQGQNFPMQPAMQQMPMQGYPMQPNMHPGMPMQGYPMQPNMQQMPQQPGFGNQPVRNNPYVNETGQSTSKYGSVVPPAYQQKVEPESAAYTWGQAQASLPTANQQEVVETKPAVEEPIYMKRTNAIDGVSIDGIFVRLNQPSDKATVGSDETYCYKSIIVSNSLREAVTELRGHQIEAQGTVYNQMFYGAPFALVNTVISTVDTSEVVNEVILTPATPLEFCTALGNFYEVINGIFTQSSANAGSMMDYYELHKFITNIEQHMLIRVNQFLKYSLGLGIDLDSFHKDYPELGGYMQKKDQTAKAADIVNFTNALFEELKDAFTSEILQLIDKELSDKAKYTKYLTDAYVANLPISSGTYNMEHEMLVNHEVGVVYNCLDTMRKKNQEFFQFCDNYIVTLDGDVYSVFYNKYTRNYKLKKVTV